MYILKKIKSFKAEFLEKIRNLRLRENSRFPIKKNCIENRRCITQKFPFDLWKISLMFSQRPIKLTIELS